MYVTTHIMVSGHDNLYSVQLKLTKFYLIQQPLLYNKNLIKLINKLIQYLNCCFDLFIVLMLNEGSKEIKKEKLKKEEEKHCINEVTKK